MMEAYILMREHIRAARLPSAHVWCKGGTAEFTPRGEGKTEYDRNKPLNPLDSSQQVLLSGTCLHKTPSLEYVEHGGKCCMCLSISEWQISSEGGARTRLLCSMVCDSECLFKCMCVKSPPAVGLSQASHSSVSSTTTAPLAPPPQPQLHKQITL